MPFRLLPGAIRLPAEEAGMAATSGALTLGGLPEDIDDILTADCRGADVAVWFGAVTARAGSVLVADPVLIWAGYVDALSASEARDGDGRSSTVTVGLASRQSQRLSAGFYHTDEDQQAEFPGDTAGRWLRAARQRLQAQVVQF